jgi:6-phosphogluconolactonase
MSYKIFSTPLDLAEAVASEMADMINKAAIGGRSLALALSGGNTPKLLFGVLADKYTESVAWSSVHFFWGDERCVPPEDPESNYGMTRRLLLSSIRIPEENIHRIRGEEVPDKEATRYSQEIVKYTRSENTFPVFDLIILGIGDDGHTASIFPGNPFLLTSNKVCDVATHPVSGQKRVTITGKVINNADKIIFMVTGSGKADLIGKIFRKEAVSLSFPAAYVVPFQGEVKWFLDKEAGRRIIL